MNAITRHIQKQLAIIEDYEGLTEEDHQMLDAIENELIIGGLGFTMLHVAYVNVLAEQAKKQGGKHEK